MYPPPPPHKHTHTHTQVMPPYDPEVVEPVHERLRAKGVELHLGDGVAGFEAGPGGKGLVVKTASGKAHAADLVVLVRAGRWREGGRGVARGEERSRIAKWPQTCRQAACRCTWVG